MLAAKKIGIDARMIEHSGIGVRIINLLNSLSNNKNIDIYVFGDERKLAKYNFDKKFKIVAYTTEIYSIREFLGHRKMKEMDILDIPHFNVPIIYLNKSIVTIHDIIPWKLKEFFPSKIKRIYLWIVFHFIKYFAKKILTVSEFTKNDLIKEFKFSPEKIEVIYNGIDRINFQLKAKSKLTQFRKKYSLPQKYFLSVGIGKEHKNVDFIIKSLKKLWLNSKLKTALVLAGTNGEIPTYLESFTIGLDNFVIPLKKISFEELPLLYQGASLLIYPSLYEGFGFPIIEAQAMNCPILSSNSSVLPEILGDTELTFDPRNENDFLEKLETVLKLKPNDKIKKAREKNLERFSWDKAATRILEIYHE